LESVRLRAIAQGYEVPLERHYVAMPVLPTALPMLATAQHLGVDSRAEVVLALNVPTGNEKNASNSVSNSVNRLWQQIKTWLRGQ
jgi:hypothetical protein